MKYTWVTIHTDEGYKGSVLDAFDFSDYILDRIVFELERRNQIVGNFWLAGRGKIRTGNNREQRKKCSGVASILKYTVQKQAITDEERKRLSDIEQRALKGELSSDDKSTYRTLVNKAEQHYKQAINQAKSAFACYESAGYRDDFIENVQWFIGPYIEDLEAISFDTFVDSL